MSTHDPIEAYLAWKASPGAASREETLKNTAALDDLFWKSALDRADKVAREGRERLLFNKYDRVLLDAGLLDPRLADSDEASLRGALLREIYTASEPNHFYLSEWLADRFRAHLSFTRMEAVRQETARTEVLIDLSPIDPIFAARNKVYGILAPFLKNLPGFSPQVVTLLCEGKLDRSIAEAALRSTLDPDSGSVEHRARLTKLRQRLLLKARTRCSTGKQLSLFDALSALDSKEEGELAKMAAALSGTAQQDARRAAALKPALSPKARADFVTSELRLVRSLLRLGTTGAGITKTHSVLLEDDPRFTKGRLTDLMELIRTVDPRLPGDPNILIAPYVGTGFFEWDRDTVFVPLHPTRSDEDAFVTALANYRILIDTLHEDQTLKRAYSRHFGSADFREAFTKDYKAWVLGVGKGFRGALEGEKFRFFRERIGPSSENIFASSNLTHVSPEEQATMLRERRDLVRRGEASWVDHYEYGVLLAMAGRPQEALDQVSLSVKLYPLDGRTLFALGYLCRMMTFADKAEAALKECIQVAPNSIWQVLASDLLTKT